MKSFLKTNLRLIIAGILATAGFFILLMISCSKTSELDEMLSDIDSLKRDLSRETQKRAGYEWVDVNLDLAREDNQNLLAKRARELSKWRDILGREDLFSEVDNKASDDVNAEISRFLDLYRKKASEHQVKFKGSANSKDGDSEVFFPSSDVSSGDEREGFGFAGYDGSWPSISDQEARELLKQKLILEKLLTTLFKSKPKGEPMELQSIHREAVGNVDKKLITNGLDVESLEKILAKRSGKIDTYAFKVDFLARTGALRTFLNSLKYPFLIRDVSVVRAENSSSPFAVTNASSNSLPFGSPQDNINGEPSPLPIIDDVGSHFSVVVEYALAVYPDLDLFKSLSSNQLLAKCSLGIEEALGDSETDGKIKTLLERHFLWNPPEDSSLSDFLKVVGSNREPKFFLK
tara:strand:+ start:1700 stop:2914 length:1215 start_codon:yes stop_codon:yes gene_type:complete